jgi:excisionase family DNA binding protein
MGRGKTWDPDWITYSEAAELLDVHKSVVERLIRIGDLPRATDRPTRKLSRRAVLTYREEQAHWLNTRQAAEVLGVVRQRVTQLADAERLPYEVMSNGKRRYRLAQVQVIANARRLRWHGEQPPPPPELAPTPRKPAPPTTSRPAERR